MVTICYRFLSKVKNLLFFPFVTLPGIYVQILGGGLMGMMEGRRMFSCSHVNKWSRIGTSSFKIKGRLWITLKLREEGKIKFEESMKSHLEKINRKRTEFKILEVISENLNDIKKYKKVVDIKKKRVGKEEEIRFKNKSEYEKYHFDSLFINLLKDKNLIDDYRQIDYDQKVKILNIWWNKKRYRSINKRSDYFNSESKFYNQINYILNLDKKNNNNTIKQLLIEKWIIDFENYRIRDLIKGGDIERSSEAKIYSNIFRSFDKVWNNKLGWYKINKYRALKKIYIKSIENNNININSNKEVLGVFIFLTLGSLNTFSLLFNKILEYVFKEGGINLNVLVMRIGENLISNFYRQLKKEIFVKSNFSDLDGWSSLRSAEQEEK